jgi:hypothetical protein
MMEINVSIKDGDRKFGINFNTSGTESLRGSLDLAATILIKNIAEADNAESLSKRPSP